MICTLYYVFFHHHLFSYILLHILPLPLPLRNIYMPIALKNWLVKRRSLAHITYLCIHMFVGYLGCRLISAAGRIREPQGLTPAIKHYGTEMTQVTSTYNIMSRSNSHTQLGGNGKYCALLGLRRRKIWAYIRRRHHGYH